MKLDDFFDAVVAFEDTKQHKPSPEPFKKALKKLALAPEECLMVGDWPERDMLGARKLGIMTAFARYGCPFDKKSKIQADFVLNDIRELPDIVEQQK